MHNGPFFLYKYSVPFLGLFLTAILCGVQKSQNLFILSVSKINDLSIITAFCAKNVHP